MSQCPVVAQGKRFIWETKEDGIKEHPWELCCDRGLKGKGGGAAVKTSVLHNGAEMRDCLSYSYLNVFSHAKTDKD